MRRAAALGLLLALLAGPAGCDRAAGNFSQHPGFRAWFAAHPPQKAPPGDADQALLRRYRPHVFVPAGSEGPISFYDDYIAEGRLYGGDGRLVSDHVTRAVLNAHKAAPGAVFVHRPTGKPAHPVIPARIGRETADLPGRGAVPFTFLTYNLVFRTSGLPAGLPLWQRIFVWLVGGQRDWHQLDHYTAVTVALAPDEAGKLAPVAAIFQQHNYLRSYLFAAADGPGTLALPADGRIAVDAALYSNELYPHRPGRTRHRAVPFLTPRTLPYLLFGEDAPWIGGEDITDPRREVAYDLGFLPPADAFYVFQGWLGARRWLPGRSGPPGADYNTLPIFKPKATEMMVFHWYEGDRDYPRQAAALFAGAPPARLDLAPFARRFLHDWRCAAAPPRESDCRAGGATP